MNVIRRSEYPFEMGVGLGRKLGHLLRRYGQDWLVEDKCLIHP